MRETVGPRRLGVLAQLGRSSERATGENLARMRDTLALEEMRARSELEKEQQIRNAEEQYRAYQAAADLESRQAQQALARSQAFSDLGLGRAQLEAGILGAERDYKDRALDYLMQAYNTASGAANQAASIAAQRKSPFEQIGSVAGGIFGI